MATYSTRFEPALLHSEAGNVASHVRSPFIGSPDGVVRIKNEVGTPLLNVSDDFDSMSLDAQAPQTHSVRFQSPSLTISTSSDRPSRPPTLQAHAHPNPQRPPTLLPNFRHPPYITGRPNGFPSINPSFSNDTQPGTSPSHHGHSPQTSPLSSTPSTFNYDSINNPSTRPRTSSHPVFHTTSDLAAHHGIPQSLPPVPRVSRYPEPPASSSSPTSPSQDFDFNALCSNYLTMLSQKPEEPTPSASALSDAAAAQALLDIIAGDYLRRFEWKMQLTHHDSYPASSPEFQMADDFMTSPLDDSSPWEELLATPALGSDDIASEFLTSPAIVDSDSFGDYGDMPLFSDGLLVSAPPQIKTPSTIPAPAPAMPDFDFAGMYTMPSPNTPALDPSSLHPSPQIGSDDLPSFTPSATRRKSAPTGTRKNVTPDSLVPYDAPIQGRKYVTPSATSRKEVPAVFARKRSRSRAFGEVDEDQLVEEDANSLPPTPNEMDAIEAKRRQNTLAARRSRKRKLEYQRELEEGLEQERVEKEAWKARSQLLEALLVSHGHEVPSYPH
ncbi:hypothetical protein EIP91_006238 [Steccherinum ochraceum]|uniref:BZIP domain-containing protein n=1 Tax=Steccherinum ochraceum TaxID=92696 RepID=A0A4R0R607_9APHY|nr:hypothetical protein EIP91_006238 [Steccherinum ochraceum]